jgi:hypothetical protein
VQREIGDDGRDGGVQIGGKIVRAKIIEKLEE